jgi:hypothetical protein
LAATLVVLAVLTTACGSGGRKGVAVGEDLSVCEAFEVIEWVPEPALDDRAALRLYTDTTVEALSEIDPRRRVDDEAVPAEVISAGKEALAAMRRFRVAVREAGADAAKVRQAAGELAVGSFSSSMAELAAFTGAEC